MTTIAEEAELGRESLCKVLGENGNPEFATVLKLMKAMGLKLSALPIEERNRGGPASPHAGRTENRRLRRA